MLVRLLPRAAPSPFDDDMLVPRKSLADDARFDVTAMVDLVFMMNIFFLVTWAEMARAEIDLPKEVARKEDAKKKAAKAAKRPAKKTAARKPVAKKSVAKKLIAKTVKKPAGKKAAAKKPRAKKASTKKTPAKKTAKKRARPKNQFGRRALNDTQDPASIGGAAAWPIGIRLDGQMALSRSCCARSSRSSRRKSAPERTCNPTAPGTACTNRSCGRWTLPFET